MDYIGIRRALHQIPELGFEEYKTQAFLLNEINHLPQDRLEVKTWRTGILVKVFGTKPDRTLGYRCDIDGLPVQEETGYSFKSEHEGCMHACGHDFHMTIALGLLERLTTHPIKDDVIVIFQPAEEGPGGALPMLQSDAFRAWKPDMIFALHIAPEYPAGTIAIKEGLLFANTSELFIDFKGTGGHAAYPHLANDMVVAASAFVTQIQSIISRRLNPLDAGVITIGKITGGTKQNIIAEQARIEGTIRALSPESMTSIKDQIEAHIAGIEAAYQCRAALDYGANYYQVYNNYVLTRKFMAFCENEGHGLTVCPEAMTGEDFGYFLKEIPGFMFWLGVDSEYGLHSSRLKPDEQAIAKAIEVIFGFMASGEHS
ncbi:N-acetyldiaminopimelate deacetylase [Scopulibacillus darangshiensis]|uniref:N-acetyldiaminopimelate deacetylase n=1 Tax=Scopulibacillus darangshiensis TaxID=442528 RepID=A0A4R2P6R0_9BACL|nr:N-acetyldiaminopimelate deacetylase [Scopulibacillus darangshiensis]TCP30543.1 N-acetyldiaminopimelate deacetylase [Scopulibacillus darangshiensis]